MEGRVKVLADEQTDRVLGIHIIGPRDGDLIAEAAVAMAFGASSEDIARTCHAPPDTARAVKEAALAVMDGVESGTVDGQTNISFRSIQE